MSLVHTLVHEGYVLHEFDQLDNAVFVKYEPGEAHLELRGHVEEVTLLSTPASYLTAQFENTTIAVAAAEPGKLAAEKAEAEKVSKAKLERKLRNQLLPSVEKKPTAYQGAPAKKSLVGPCPSKKEDPKGWEAWQKAAAERADKNERENAAAKPTRKHRGVKHGNAVKTPQKASGEARHGKKK